MNLIETFLKQLLPMILLGARGVVVAHRPYKAGVAGSNPVGLMLISYMLRI